MQKDNFKIIDYLRKIIREEEFDYVLELMRKEQHNFIVLSLIKEKKFKELDIINYIEKIYNIGTYNNYITIPNSNILKDALSLNLIEDKMKLLNCNNKLDDYWYELARHYDLFEGFTLKDLKVWTFIAKEKLEIKDDIDFKFIIAYFFNVITCPYNYPLSKYSLDSIYSVLDKLKIEHIKLELYDFEYKELDINIVDYFYNINS